MPSSTQGPTKPGPATSSPAAELVLSAERVAQGLDRPVYVTAPPGNPRLFVLEQAGVVRVIEDGRLRPEPFLNVRADVRLGGERGFLGLAFHPDYATSGRFVVHYSAQPDGDTVLEEYRVSSDPARADAASRRLLLRVDQPSSLHNGGMVTFGPDGMLYVGLGDGGKESARNAQDPTTLLGSLLRLDVDRPGARGRPYAIPPDNPFAAGGGSPEVWAFGLRNPWRFSFDPLEGLLYVGDVGQYRFEEIDVVPAHLAGLNFGWPIREGHHCYPALHDSCRSRGLVAPTVEYPHDDRCAVIGGFVYRGRALPALSPGPTSTATSAPAPSAASATARVSPSISGTGRTDALERLGTVTSLGLDSAGEVLVTTHEGVVYRLVNALAPR